MAQTMQFIIFGDQTHDSYRNIHDLLLDSSNPLLTSFFERAYHALRLEIGKLPSREREEFPRFSSIADLLTRQRETGLNPALEKSLTCISQLGCFISHNGQSGQLYPKATDTYLLGLCTGMLSTAAISSCKTLSELLVVAVQTMLVAFRTGLCAMDVRNRIEPGQELTPAWSMIMPRLTAKEAAEGLDKFCQAKCIPLTSRPYISAYSSNSVTISGPPGVLASLRTSPVFAELSAIKIPIHAPYHASHLYSRSDIDSILETTPARAWEMYTANIPVISSTTGELISADNFRSLLEVALTEILLEPINWDKAQQGVGSLWQASDATQFKVTPIGINAEQTILPALNHVEGSDSSGRNPGRIPYSLPSPFNELSHGEPKDTARIARSASGRADKSKIAIIGMSGRFPEADSPDAFWDLLYKGLDVHKEVPPSHWDVKTHVDVTGKAKNTSATPYGCWLNNPGMFDARFFNMSPKEAPQVDPAQRLALMTAYEAIEQAGIVPDGTPSTRKDRVGVFYGVTSNDWIETNSAQDIGTYFIPGGNRAFIPGRINYFFKFSGPSFSVDTACSSSLAAMHVACNSLWRGDIDTAIAGGTNILTNPDFTAGLDRGHFLSRTGNCKTFDDGADGYCRGEGVGTVILKRLEDAIADHDPIQGVILGAYTNHSAEAESITRPHVDAQRALFDKILSATGMDPYKISYVEMHGTGTQAGDAGEMKSVLETFAPATARQKRTKHQPLYLGSAKSNLGHGEAVAGVTSLAKILLMMKKSMIPPHCGIKTKINHKFPTDLEERNVHIAKKPIPWNRDEGKTRTVFLNNFSAAGGNTALLIEDAPVEALLDGNDPRSMHLVAISAKCAASLKGNLKSLLAFLDGPHTDGFSLARLSYTTTARRIHHQHRVITSCSSVQQLKARLESAIKHDEGATRAKSVPKVVFTFTGQGSQYPGMGKQLIEAFSQFRSDIHRFDQLAQAQGFPTFLPFFMTDDRDVGDFSPLIVQLASTCMQMALAGLWASWGIKPTAVVGHSLGEYSALNVAGVLSDSETIYVVGKRARLLQEKCNSGTHSMLAVKASTETISSLLTEKKYEVACINSPEETVLSGTGEDISDVQEILGAHNLKATVLKVPYAFHSSQVVPILEDFEEIIQGVSFNKPSIPVICPLLGTVVTESGTFGPRYLGRHCREVVNIVGALESARDAQVITDKTFMLEIGPHPVVSGMVKSTFGSHMTVLPTMQRRKDVWVTLTEAISCLYSSGNDIQWTEYHRDFKSAHKVLELPAYSWDLKNYWMQYVNDWSLRKGDPLPIIPWQVAAPKLETTTVHRVVDDHAEGNKVTMVTESDISRPDINPIVQGHKVDSVPLCTPSVYADIVLTMGKYLLARYKPDSKDQLVDVSDMTVKKALIARTQGPQLVRARAEVDWASNSAKCAFYSVDETGKTTAEHAHCTIKFTDMSQLSELERKAPGIKARMENLRNGLATGKSERYNKSMVYKMVGTLAQFNPGYRGIDEVVMDSSRFEACGRISFGGIRKDGIFTINPAYLDSLSQLGGFVMNANDDANLDVEVFVNHGWGSFQIFKGLDSEKVYQTHVQMARNEGNMWGGDIVVFCEDKVVASIKGVVLQGVPRRVLRHILTAEAKANTAPVQKTNGKQNDAVTSRPRAQVLQAVKVFEPTQPSKVEAALQIIAEESGIAVDELTDNTFFSDMGIDSLLSLVITSRFREELSLDLDVESMFIEFPTVKSLKKFLEPENQPIPVVAETDPSPPEIHQEASNSGHLTAAFNIIAEESGVAIAELTDDCVFSDMGVDSLLSLVIASRFREELSVEMDLESMFINFPTVKDLKQFFTGGENAADPTQAANSLQPMVYETPTSSSDYSSRSSTPGTSVPTSSSELSLVSSSGNKDKAKTTPRLVPQATSVLLQGLPRDTRKTLFLFPDGCGSSTSYSSLPKLSLGIAIVGLNSPYLKNPQDMKCTVDQLVHSFLAEIRQRQPNGPYDLGGWSSGGIVAFRAAQILIEQGEDVLSLILIDSPIPKGLEKLPQRFYDHCSSMGVFGQTGGASSSPPPAWLIPHFNATIDVLHDYYAEPLPEGILPKVSIIWACECVMDREDIPKLPPRLDNTEGMKFLTEKRTDFSARGWEELFPGREVIVQKMVGADHFSMMRGQYAKKLAMFIEQAIA